MRPPEGGRGGRWWTEVVEGGGGGRWRKMVEGGEGREVEEGGRGEMWNEDIITSSLCFLTTRKRWSLMWV